MPTTNRFEVTMERVILIHAVIIREDIQVDEIIAEQMYKFVNKTNIRSKLPFPSVISLLCKEAKTSIPGDTLIPQEAPICGEAMGRVRGPREPRQNPPHEQEIEEEAPQQQHQNFQQQQNFPHDFMANFNNTMAAMQQHYDQRWDAFQQKFDDAQEENRRNFGTINQRMNEMDDQLSFLCYSHQMANENMLFPYQNTTRQIREMEQQGIPVTMANLNIHRNIEEAMRQERMRYEKILEEAAAQKAREKNKGKARGIEEEYDDEEIDEEGGEWKKEEGTHVNFKLQWFEDMFGQLPEPQHRDACTVIFSWFTSTFEMFSDDAKEELVVRNARAYITILLSTALFEDNTVARVHLRWLPFMDRIDDLGGYNWGSAALTWPYRGFQH
ncbi:hypothetical protein PIB30_052136 [Stylosanthes scabra]|uniref:Aminotransferase-like plant mobile domain-containing protein n=1 Tax=Stylosanthes scabra TaxID=79078 RepID=A0ABU6XJ05_9FABA|nr:hypothetical protein [Stylosanthes scabra]